MRRIAVYCGSNSGNKDIFKAKAYELGAALARNCIDLVYGGAKVGLMGEVANGTLDHGGKAIGVLPHFLAEKELRHNHLTETILVDTMHERKAKMSEAADGFIALPGGFGTLEELFEMLTWAQLCLHKKPIGILNTEGYYDSLILFINTMYQNGFLQKEYLNLLLVSDDIDILLDNMKKYSPISTEKWFTVN